MARKFSLRSYNAFLRRFRALSGVSHADAQEAYRLTTLVLGRSALGVDATDPELMDLVLALLFEEEGEPLHQYEISVRLTYVSRLRPVHLEVRLTVTAPQAPTRTQVRNVLQDVADYGEIAEGWDVRWVRWGRVAGGRMREGDVDDAAGFASLLQVERHNLNVGIVDAGEVR